MNSEAVLAALEDMEHREHFLAGIVHSHPDGPATPSATDLREFRYPGAMMVIADLSSGNPDLRAWNVDPFRVRPVEVRIIVTTATDIQRATDSIPEEQ